MICGILIFILGIVCGIISVIVFIHKATDKVLNGLLFPEVKQDEVDEQLNIEH